MSAHVISRLSAFLDRELTETEAAGVRQHVADCEDCAARLREMEGVDRAIAGMPADAPSGYFDSFAARVRSRIETAPLAATPGKAGPGPGFRLPTWAWAVAAALLLGVLLPRLPWDRQRPRSRAERDAPAASSAPPSTLEPPERALRQAKSRIPAADPQDATPGDAFAEGALDDKRANEAVVARPSAAAPTQMAPAPPPALSKPPAKKDAGRTSSEATHAPVAEAQLRMREDGASGAPPAEEKLRSAGLEKDEVEVAPAATPAQGMVVLGGATEAKRRSAPSALSASGSDAPAAKRALKAETEFETLATRLAESLEDLRRLREAWRSFLSHHAEGPRADAARVAVIAVSVEIAVRSRTSEDEAEARRAAKAYLARDDAAQKARVHDLLARLPEVR